MRTLYDEVPYPGRAFAQTHPDRLATLATLFGMTPAPPGACRVLELGCGDGANLLPMAAALPGSNFVGIDLAGEAIGRARTIAAELGLANVRFEHLGIEDYAPPVSGFDYVIAHGFYSWVPAPVRDRLLAVCASALAADGVAFVSYNALPGNRLRQTLREMLAYALAGVDDPAERIAAARALLAQGGEAWGTGEGLEATLGGQARFLLAQNDEVFLHDTLSPVNAPVYFHEFAAHAAGHGLKFLAEAEFAQIATAGLPGDLARWLQEIDDLVRREQLLDFYKQRMFRQTLLCHAAVPVERRVAAGRAAALAAAGHYESTAEAGSGRVTFIGAAGEQVGTDHPLLIEALRRIDESWPQAVWVEELAGGADATAESRALVCEAMVPCFALGLVHLHVDPPQPARRPGRLPRTTALARLQARERTHLTTLRHSSIRLDDELGWRLVALLDGTRDRAALLAELEAATNGGYPDLEAALEHSLEALAAVGLLLPDDPDGPA